VSGPSGNPSEPTEPRSREGGDQSGRPGPRTEDGTEKSGGPTTEPEGGERTVSLDSQTTGAWGGNLPDTVANQGGSGDDPTSLIGEGQSDPSRGSLIRYIGDYELLGVVGKGGMGIVYRARQVSLNREVALKLIRLEGLESESEARRFQHEAEAIASLDHPGIVPIYEIGIHEGRHYFSMKLISGESLDQASRRLRGDYTSIGRILAGAARAVQHAHERCVLHRDLKPGNILLDAKDIPHVTDFGVAKRIDTGDSDATETGTIAGTPAYMAPEQATATRGSITTATDVYGLGAILYALLSGRAPHRGSSILQVLDAVRDEEPEPPSKLNPMTPRDLDVICMKCLETVPRRRYHSAGDLADDLDRWLEGRPITARHVGVPARAVMWCKRRPLVAGLAAALLITACLGATGILINWFEVRRQRDELARANIQIRSEWETSRQLNEFLVSDLLAWSSPFLAGRRDIPVSKLLDRSANLAASRFARYPKIEGSIRQALGNGYLALGILLKAEAELALCTTLRKDLPEGDELDRLSTEYVLARLRIDQGRYDEAEAHALRAFEGRKARLGENDPATLQAEELVGAILIQKGKLDDARKLLEKTADTARRTLGDEDLTTLQARSILAILDYDQGRFPEALASFERISAAFARVLGSEHPDVLLVRSYLGATLMSLGEDSKAEAILVAIIGPAREILGADHPETLRINGILAAVRVNLKKFAEAAQGMDETLKAQRQALPADHMSLFSTEINRAVGLLQQQKTVEGELILRDLLPRMRARLKPDDNLLGIVLTSRASALWELSRTADAEPINAEAIEIFRKTLPAEHPQVVNAEATQAQLLLANGKPAEAEKLAVRVVEIRSRPGWVGNPWRLGALKSVLGATRVARKQLAEGEALLLEGFKIIEADPKAIKIRRDEALERLIQYYESTGKTDEAATWRKLRTPAPGP
jgi:tetratricopeptide (TPR) repeat protein/tRNA A-37 threonylcarbamoyl transferase component Bud32